MFVAIRDLVDRRDKRNWRFPLVDNDAKVFGWLRQEVGLCWTEKLEMRGLEMGRFGVREFSVVYMLISVYSREYELYELVL